MIIAEMACYYMDKKMSLFDALNALYDKYGYFDELTESIYIKGVDGAEKIKEISSKLRNNPPEIFGKTKVVKIRAVSYTHLKNTYNKNQRFKCEGK